MAGYEANALSLKLGYITLPNSVISAATKERMQDKVMSANQFMPLTFPATRSSLWDHRSIGQSTIVHLSHRKNPAIFLEEQTLRIVHHLVHETASDECVCRLVGSVHTEPDGSTVNVTVDRVDTGRQSKFVKELPTGNLAPGEIDIPCAVTKNGAKPSCTEEDYLNSFQMILDRSYSCGPIDISRLLSVRANCSYHGDMNNIIVHIDFDVILPSITFKLTPINPLPVLPTALSKNLSGPRSISEVQGEPKSGFMTMDQTRRLFLVLESDPKVQMLPIVGIWSSGVANVDDPFIWCSLLRYTFNTSLKERVCLPPEPFLVTLYSPLHSRPEFYECTLDGGQRRMDYTLAVCHDVLQFNKDSVERSKSPIEMELSPVMGGGQKMDVFQAALQRFKIEIRNADIKKNKGQIIVNSSSEEIVPRTFPLPHVSQSSGVEPSVPEVTLLFDGATEELSPWQQNTQKKSSTEHLSSGRGVSSPYGTSTMMQQQQQRMQPLPGKGQRSCIVQQQQQQMMFSQQTGGQIGPRHIGGQRQQIAPQQMNGQMVLFPQPTGGQRQISPQQTGGQMMMGVSGQFVPTSYNIQMQPAPVAYQQAVYQQFPCQSVVVPGHYQTSVQPCAYPMPQLEQAYGSMEQWRYPNGQPPARKALRPQVIPRANQASRVPIRPLGQQQSRPLPPRMTNSGSGHIVRNSSSPFLGAGDVNATVRPPRQVATNGQPHLTAAASVQSCQTPVVSQGQISAHNSGSTDSGLQINDSSSSLQGSPQMPGIDVYHLLSQQDAELKALRQEIAELRKDRWRETNRSCQHEDNVVQSSSLSDSSKPNTLNSHETRNVAINTTFHWNPPPPPSGNDGTKFRSSSTDPTNDNQLTIQDRSFSSDSSPTRRKKTTSPRKQRLSSEQEIVQGNEAAFGSFDLTFNDLHLSHVENKSIQDESIVSELMMDLPDYTSLSPEKINTSHDMDRSPMVGESISVYQEGGCAPVMPSCGFSNADTSTTGNIQPANQEFLNKVNRLVVKHNQSKHYEEATAATSMEASRSAPEMESYELDAEEDEEDEDEVEEGEDDYHEMIMADITNRSQPTSDYTMYNSTNEAFFDPDQTFIPKINYVSLMLDSCNSSDMSIAADALAIKYLNDERLSERAKLLATSGRNEGRDRKAKKGGRSDISMYGLPLNQMSFASQKYLERHGLIKNIASRSKEKAPTTKTSEQSKANNVTKMKNNSKSIDKKSGGIKVQDLIMSLKTNEVSFGDDDGDLEGFDFQQSSCVRPYDDLEMSANLCHDVGCNCHRSVLPPGGVDSENYFESYPSSTPIHPSNNRRLSLKQTASSNRIECNHPRLSYDGVLAPTPINRTPSANQATPVSPVLAHPSSTKIRQRNVLAADRTLDLTDDVIVDCGRQNKMIENDSLNIEVEERPVFNRILDIERLRELPKLL